MNAERDSISADIEAAINEVEQNQEAAPEVAAVEKPIADKEPAKVDEPNKQEATEAKKDATDKESEPEAKADAEDKPIPFPVSMSKEEREHFAKLPREAQAYIVRRESERDRGFQKKTEELADTKKQFDAITQAFKPFESQMARVGMNIPTAINNFVQIQSLLDRDPMGGLRHIARTYGIDLDRQLPSAQVPAASGYVPPEITQEIGSIKAQLQAQEYAKQAAMATEVNTAIESFASAQDKDGTPMHPYFNDVQNDMVLFAEHIRREHPAKSASDILQEAYDRAVWANPATRQALQYSLAMREQRERQKASMEKARNAKNAGVSVKSSSADARSIKPPEHNSVRDSLMAAFAQFEQ